MAIRLEVFETGRKDDPSEMVVTDSGHFEEMKLASFEEGYSAGWEDAVAAHSGDQTRIRDDLARNFQSLAFTYHEAREHILQSIEPLIREMVTHILPKLARASLGPLVLETLRPLIAEAANAPMVLVINPGARPAVEAVLSADKAIPLLIQDEPSLGEGQAYIRFARSETRIDLDRALASITAAMDDFFKLALTETDNG